MRFNTGDLVRINRRPANWPKKRKFDKSKIYEIQVCICGCWHMSKPYYIDIPLICVELVFTK